MRRGQSMIITDDMKEGDMYEEMKMESSVAKQKTVNENDYYSYQTFYNGKTNTAL